MLLKKVFINTILFFSTFLIISLIAFPILFDIIFAASIVYFFRNKIYSILILNSLIVIILMGIDLSLEKDERISNAIHKVISLSEKFYKNGFAGLKYIPISTRLGIFIAANVYRGIGIKIKSNKKKYIRKRVYLNLFEKSLITLKSVFIFIFIPLMNYKYKKIRDSLPNENL